MKRKCIERVSIDWILGASCILDQLDPRPAVDWQKTPAGIPKSAPRAEQRGGRDRQSVSKRSRALRICASTVPIGGLAIATIAYQTIRHCYLSSLNNDYWSSHRLTLVPTVCFTHSFIDSSWCPSIRSARYLSTNYALFVRHISEQIRRIQFYRSWISFHCAYVHYTYFRRSVASLHISTGQK